MFRKLSSNCFRLCIRVRGSRNCSSSKENAEIKGPPPITKIPLSDPVPWLPRPIYTTPSEFVKETRVTTLDNGMRVASEPKFGSFCTVGILIDSGSRYECPYPSGLSHFLEKLSFGNTTSLSNDQIMRHFDELGGIYDCQSSRDTLIYASSVETKGLNKIVEILSEITLRPLITNQEIEVARQAILFELEDLLFKPEKDSVLMEMVHATAYTHNTLGLPKLCPKENALKIDRDMLFTYLNNHHTPDRMVLAGVGVDHDTLVEYAQRHFVEKNPIWKEDKTIKLKNNMPVDNSHSQYTGGFLKEEADLSNLCFGPNPLPELAHMVIGLESVGHQHKDFVACCVLNMIMGGGGSFSAGGPGKGMYTRLYTNALNRYHWMFNATALNHAYIDTGLFCIQASAHPMHLADLAQVVIRELVGMAGNVNSEELQRAKAQLQSMLLMNLESRPVVFEDVGRQVLATGKRLQPEYFMEQINNITANDIVSVASNMLKTKPSVAALGALKSMPSMSAIESALEDKGGKFPSKSRFSIFR